MEASAGDWRLQGAGSGMSPPEGRARAQAEGGGLLGF